MTTLDMIPIVIAEAALASDVTNEELFAVSKRRPTSKVSVARQRIAYLCKQFYPYHSDLEILDYLSFWTERTSIIKAHKLMTDLAAVSTGEREILNAITQRVLKQRQKVIIGRRRIPKAPGGSEE